MSVFFSIIVPVYNVESFLEECFLSIAKQSFNDYEIIFINDGSTDSSGEICDAICRKFTNASTIHKLNGGLSDARNVGINIARGSYVILLDSDDKLNTNALEELHNLIRNNNDPDVVLNRIKLFSNENKLGIECKYKFTEELKEKSVSGIFQQLIRLDDYVPGAWTLVTKRKHIITNELFFVKGLLHEDEQWTPRTILKAKSIAFNNSCLYLYRQGRTGSITQMKNIRRELDKLWIVESLYNERKSNTYSQSSSVALLERASDLYWGVLVRSSQYKSNLEEFNLLIDELHSKQSIFKLSKNKKYVVFNVFLNVFGIRTISILISILAIFKKESS